MIDDASGRAPDPPPVSSPPPLHGLHILVVDDNEDTREMLRRSLSYFGAAVTTVASAGVALDILRQINPSVILSDLSMPQHDGYWLLKMVHLMRGGLPVPPAIAMTAYRESQPEPRAYEAGFAAYLEKPLDFRQLVAAIRKVTGR
jgi:CheY-like chemotaxis protein